MTKSIRWAGPITIALYLACGQTVTAAPSARMLIETTDMSGLSISPDGEHYAFRTERASIERNSYDSAWYVGDMADRRPPIRVSDGGVAMHTMGLPVPESPQWSANSDWIYFRAQFDGQVQIWRARRDGSRSEAVTHDPADVGSFVLSEDGSHLIYQVGATRDEIRAAEAEEYDAGIRIDGHVPVGQGLYKSGYRNGVLSTERYSGSWVIRQGLLDDGPRELKRIDLGTLTATAASSNDQAWFETRGAGELTKKYGLMSWAVRSAANQIAYLKDEGATTRLHLVDAVHNTDSVCLDPACDGAQIKALAWRPGHNELILTTSDQSRAQSLYGWDIGSGRVRLIAKSDGLINGGRPIMGGESCAVGPDDAVCVMADANTPPRLERVNLKTGAGQVIFDPNVVMAQRAGPAVETLDWKDSDGHTFTGQYFPPVQNRVQPAPLVISYYTCPGFLRGGDIGDEWPLATLAGDGIAGLCINMVSDPDATTNYQVAERGIRAIVEQLSRSGRVDPAKIGMAGLSFGSETVWWMTEKTSLLKAAAVTSSPITPTYYWFHSVQPGFAETVRQRWQLGAPGDTPEQWRLLSPVYQVENIHAAILMQMPEQEYLQTMEVFGRLSRTSTPIDLYAFPNEPHNKFMPRHQLAAYTRNVDWFRFWLQGFEDPDPAKAEQYRLWRAMRETQATHTVASPGRQ